MYIKNIKLENYMSFKKLNLELEKNKLYIITGKNLDKNSKNGVGKSAIIEGIIYSIFGKNIRLGSNDIKEIINNNENYVKTQIEFGNYNIERLRNKKSKNECKIIKYENNKKIDLTKRTTKDTNEFIEKYILPYNQFLYTNYFNPYNLIFFSLTPKQKYEIIETLLQLDIIDEILEKYKNEKDIIKNKLDEININKEKLLTELNYIKKDIETFENEKINLENIIKKLKNEKDKKKTEMLNEIKNEILYIINNIKKYNDEYEKCKNEYLKYKEKYEKYDINNGLNINNLNYEYNNYLSTLNILSSIYKNCKSTKEKGICPTCKRPFIIDEEKYITDEIENRKYDIHKKIYDEIKNENIDIEKLKLKIDKIENTLKEIKNKIDEYTKTINEYNKYEKLKQQKESKLEILKNFIENIKNTKSFSYNIVNKHNLSNNDNIDDIIQNDEEIKKEVENKIKNINVSGKINELENNINKINTKIKEKKDLLEEKNRDIKNLKKEYENILKKIEKYDILIKELSYNGSFRNKLIENYINELEKSLNIMLTQLIPDFNIKLEIVEKGRNKGINILIYDNDIEKSYGQLSTGEKRLVDIALLLTFSSLNNTFILIDEALDSLSYENQEKVINLLLQLEKQVFLVTHNEKLLSKIKDNEKIKFIILEKQNGISYLKEGV